MALTLATIMLLSHRHSGLFLAGIHIKYCLKLIVWHHLINRYRLEARRHDETSRVIVAKVSAIRVRSQ